jgi:hypothetical protein
MYPWLRLSSSPERSVRYDSYALRMARWVGSDAAAPKRPLDDVAWVVVGGRPPFGSVGREEEPGTELDVVDVDRLEPFPWCC